MKRVLVSVVLAGVIAGAALAEAPREDAAAAGPSREVGLLEGVRIGGGAGASVVDDKPVGFLDLSVTTAAADWVDVGLRLLAVHTLERSYTDGEGRDYQAEVAYATALLRPHLALGNAVELGLPLSVGRGLIQYRYEYEYRDELTWSEEILDRVGYAVYTAGGDLRVNLGAQWGLQAEGGYRLTSPLGTPLADDEDLFGPYARLGMTYLIR